MVMMRSVKLSYSSQLVSLRHFIQRFHCKSGGVVIDVPELLLLDPPRLRCAPAGITVAAGFSVFLWGSASGMKLFSGL